MTKGYAITNDGPITVSVPAGARVTVEYGERRNPAPRRRGTWRPLIGGMRKACIDRRLVHGGFRFVLPDLPADRRDPNRKMYQYRTSADPRIRALERRHVRNRWADAERRDGFDRRNGSSTPELMRRQKQRRKS